jgi:hypothetical protein
LILSPHYEIPNLKHWVAQSKNGNENNKGQTNNDVKATHANCNNVATSYNKLYTLNLARASTLERS